MNTLSNNLSALEDVITIMRSSDSLLTNIAQSALKINAVIKSGGKILIAGNGGSAAEAQHFSAELIGRFKKERDSFPSIALTTDTSILTAVGNDYGFEKIFERQIEGLGLPGDVFIAMSTSGNSPNIIEAVKKAKEKNIFTVGLLGRNGGLLKNLVDIAILVPSENTARIQEIHLVILHSWCEDIDAEVN